MTPVTVTNPTRGSFSFGISSARISRNSSATRLGRLPSGIASGLRVVQRQLAVDELDLAPAVDELLDLVHDPPRVVLLAGDGRDGDRGALPQVVMVDLGDATR